MHRIRRLKCDAFGIGSAIGGATQAAAQIYAADQAASASRYAADQSYQGALATNDANIQMANKLNDTNIQNTRETNATNIQLNNQTNAANRALAEQQNQWNLEQWNRQNEYNSPAHQVKLYREAGLNPATLAGSGWSDAQELNSAPLANQVAPQIQSPQASALPSLINPAAESAQIQMQGALQQSQIISNIGKNIAEVLESVSRIKKNKSDIDVNKADVQKMFVDMDFVRKQTGWIDKLSTADLSVKMETANQLRANIGLLDSQKQKIQAEADLAKFDLGIKQKFSDIIEKMPEAELERLVTSNLLARSQAGLANTEAALNRMVAATGTQIPTVKSPADQFLWDMYNYLTDNGTKNIIEVLGKATGVIKTAAGAARKIQKVVRVVKRVHSMTKTAAKFSRSSPYRNISPTAPVP